MSAMSWPGITAQSVRFRGLSRRRTSSPADLPAGSTPTLFADERGNATLFFPVIGEFRPVGRVGPMSVPGAELAVITHSGSHDDLDRSYGALAAYVSEHALAVDGLIRECYVIGPHDTDDESAWRTEIGWPIFDTATDGG